MCVQKCVTTLWMSLTYIALDICVTQRNYWNYIKISDKRHNKNTDDSSVFVLMTIVTCITLTV